MAARIPVSITLDREVVEQIKKTRGKASVSERVNHLLKRALLAERYKKLEEEAARFFAEVGAEEREESEAIYRLSLETMQRDE